MKTLRPLYILSFFAFCLLINNLQLNAQALYYGPDKIVDEGDSVVLHLHDYVGTIQWQKSYNKKTWSNISGATDDTLLFIADKTTYFRAKVIAGKCDPYYSDEIYVNVYTKQKNVVDIHKTDLKLLSDSIELNQGIYRYQVSKDSLVFPKNTVLFCPGDTGYLRLIDTTILNKNEIVVHTSQGMLVDYFNQIDIHDSIKILSYDNNYLRQKSTEKFDGRLVPINIKTPLDTTKKLKSSGFDKKIEINKNIEIAKGVTAIINGTITFGPTIEKEIKTCEDKNALSIPFPCNISKDAEEYLNVCDKGFQLIDKARLQKVSLSVRGEVTLNLTVKLIAEKSLHKKAEKTFFSYNVPFAIGPVPATFEMEFVAGARADLDVKGELKGCEVNATGFVELGAEYIFDKNIGDGQWQLIKEKGLSFTKETFDFKFYGHAGVKGYVGLESSLEILGAIGPYLQVNPYIEGAIDVYSNDWTYEIGIYGGIGANANVQVDLLGYEMIPFDYPDFDLLPPYEFWSDKGQLLIHPPLLNTANVSSIKILEAESGGINIKDGSKDITDKGICWSESPNPGKNDNCKSAGTGNADYNLFMDGLNPSTQYYVKAFAENSEGIGFGDEKVFATKTNPQVATNQTINTSTNSAEIEGEITNDGGASIVEHGVCYSKSGTPDINDNVTNEGNGSTGTFTTTMTSLSSGQTYNVRAYAKNSVGGVGYGSELTVHTENPVSLPKIDIIPVTDIKNVTAKSGGKNIDAGGGTITEKGLCWNTTGTPTTSDNKNSEGTGEVDFTSTISSLTPGEKYYVRAYATNSKGTAYSSTTETFTTTEPGTPIVTITNHYGSNTGDLTVEYNVDLNSGSAITERGIILDGVKQPSDGTGDGDFSKTISVSQDNIHNIKVYATNADGKTDESSIKTYGWSKCYSSTLNYSSGRVDKYNKYSYEIKAGTSTANLFYGWVDINPTPIPDNVSINRIFLNIYTNDLSKDLMSELEITDMMTPYGSTRKDIISWMGTTETIYATSTDAMNNLDWHVIELNNEAISDLQSDYMYVDQFVIGFREKGNDHNRAHFDGYDTSNKPYTIVTYE